MSRPANRVSTGRANKANGRKQFNAALAEQLVLDFNKAASEHGRDALLENLIYKFLERARPDSPSVLQFRQKAQAVAHSEFSEAQLDHDAAAELERVIDEREALTRVRDLATQIVEISSAALMRKPPKRTEPTPPLAVKSKRK